MLAIVNYKVGNLGSLENMLRSLNVQSCITSDPDTLRKADRFILPGVGAFGFCMENLSQSGLVPVLREQVFEAKKPILGICVGMQLLAESSEEGGVSGLGWLPGHVRRFTFDVGGSSPRIPHMGWNFLKDTSSEGLFRKSDPKTRFYFVHSYHWQTDHTEIVAARCHYGYDFVASVRRDNIYGVQFHPEKSLRFGKELLRNFVDLC